MSFLTNGLPSSGPFTGVETLPLDTNAAAQPSQVSLAVYKMALMLTTMLNTLSKTPVAGTIYYARIDLGVDYTPTPQGADISLQSYTITGVNVPVGATGGTDTLHVGIWDSTGVLVGRSETAGVTLGTALTIQQVPLAGSSGTATGVNAPVTLPSGTYYVGVQLSGTTGRFLAVNSPIWPVATGSQTGVSGTLPAISSIASTYTANVGPAVSLY